MECLEQEYAKPSHGARSLAVLEARNLADTAIAAARVGYPGSTTRERLWAVNPDLPASERKANEKLIDAAADLRAAAYKAFAALAGHVDNADVVGALRDAISRAPR